MVGSSTITHKPNFRPLPQKFVKGVGFSANSMSIFFEKKHTFFRRAAGCRGGSKGGPMRSPLAAENFLTNRLKMLSGECIWGPKFPLLTTFPLLKICHVFGPIFIFPPKCAARTCARARARLNRMLTMSADNFLWHSFFSSPTVYVYHNLKCQD